MKLHLMEREPLKELDIVALIQEFLNEGELLPPGLVGTIVLVHQGGESYEVEFVNDHGTTTAIATIPAANLRRQVSFPSGGEGV